FGQHFTRESVTRLNAEQYNCWYIVLIHVRNQVCESLKFNDEPVKTELSIILTSILYQKLHHLFQKFIIIFLYKKSRAQLAFFKQIFVGQN
ncbi:hypothetical protein ACJX0J_041283, partial [Zea mays]